MKKHKSYQLERVDQKLAVFMGLMLLVLMIIVLAASNHLFNRLQKEYNDRLSIAIAVTISESISRVSFSGKFHTRKLAAELTTKVKELAYISVESLDNKVFAHSDQARNDTPVLSADQKENSRCLTLKQPIVAEKNLNNLMVNEVIIPYRGGIDDEVMGVVKIGIDFTDLRKSQTENFSKLLFLIAVLTIFSIFLAHRLSRYFGRSVRYLASQLQGILDHAPMGLVISKSDGSIALASRETATLFPSTGLAETVAELNQSLDSPIVAEKLNELEKSAFSGHGYVEAEFEVPKNAERKAYWQISKFPIALNEKGESALICSFFRDTTEKRLAAERLQESEETFRRLFENSSDAIMLLKEGRFVECNQATLDLAGMATRDQFLGLTPAEISPESQPDGLPTSEAITRKYEEATGQGYNRFEWLFKKTDDTTFFVDVALMPIVIRGKEMIHMTWRDITGYKQAEQEREKLQKQFLQAQRMDAVVQLAGGVAHDFNNLLAGIMGAAELLKKPELTVQKHETYLEMILTTTVRAADLTKKLLTFARKRERENKPVDLHRTIADSIEILTRTLNKNVIINFEHKAESCAIVGDETMLQNVFLNLGINASHAMPDGGTLSFLVRNVSLDSDYCSISPFDLTPGTFVEVEIRDNGCGMTMDVQKKIFEPFFTTKDRDKGTGLGLSMAYGVVKSHAGAINVYSEVGVGTVFHVYLPLAPHADIKSIEDMPVIRGSGKILLVDDEEMLRSLGQTILESLGYEVIVAADGREAVEVFEKAADEIELVILDMIMPTMGGKETLVRLKELKPDCKVIVSSGFAKEDELSEMEKIGICSFLRKPFRIAEMSQMIAKVIGNVAD
ncbi:MAG: response regulator [Candidatus Riflebacteria bacterium]|nr:response regulator [Candidatus Riflebacteria bacterium]